MKSVSLSGSPRENVGKKDAKRVRKEGNIPCVLYGGKEQVHFTVSNLGFEKLIFTPDVFLVNIELGEKSYQAILQDVQYHPVSDKVLHADFLEVVSEKPVTVALPVQIEGSAPGVLAGGRLNIKLRKLRVRGLVEDLPEYIVVNISDLKIGSSVKVKDVATDKLQFLETENTVIVNVKMARGALDEEEEEEEEEGAEGEATEAAAPAEE